MGKRYTMCEGTHGVEWERLEEPLGFTGFSTERPTNVKRKLLTCPNCKRRLHSSVELEHDGFYVIHSIPAHKPKEWWKKGKPRKVRR